MSSLPWYIYLLQFVAGLFLANGVPHFVDSRFNELIKINKCDSYPNFINQVS